MSNKYIDKVTGPVIPLPTPFNANEEVAYEDLAKYVRFLIDNGIKNLMTTVGTSRFNLLSFEEVKKVNATVVEAAAGEAITIVANPLVGGTKMAIDFAKHSESIGADFLLAYFPERHYGEDNTYDFFEAVGNSTDIGILLHEMPMRNGIGGGSVQYSIPLLHRLLEIENVVGLKEESMNTGYSQKILKEIAHKAVIIGAGGGMSRYLRDYWLGAKAFLGGIGNFYPQLELDFYAAMMAKDYETAHKIVYEQEQPYFEKVVPMGWHPSLKVALAVKELMPLYERRPMKQASQEDKKYIHQILQNNNWL
ncbi:MAG: dihydrodipicolinate synthase family protein [Chitinophagales bacterium]